MNAVDLVPGLGGELALRLRGREGGRRKEGRRVDEREGGSGNHLGAVSGESGR